MKEKQTKLYYFDQAIYLLSQGISTDHPLFIHILEMSGEPLEKIMQTYIKRVNDRMDSKTVDIN